ncbi:MAG: DUF4416 family protein [Nitrospirota bacterium]
MFVGMIAGSAELFSLCTERLVSMYGPVDLQSDVLPWDHSSYYREEMGTGLRRMFIVFERLLDPGALAGIKIETIRLEGELSRSGLGRARRTVNLDPGYITEAKVVLATTKDFPHRVYIGNRIYAESTLHYSRGERAFTPVEHTYPDFRTPSSIALFGRARERLRSDLQKRGSGSERRSVS